VSRRRFVQGLAGTATLTALSRFASALPLAAYPFEEFRHQPADHVEAYRRKSPEKYLPETTGAGCAFLDYDNDGWMDIYLVNSGQCDFLRAQSSAA